MKRSSYTYRYFPRVEAGPGFFGTSGGRAPFVLTNEVEGSSTYNLGAYFRINGIVRLRKRTVIEMSPFLTSKYLKELYRHTHINAIFLLCISLEISLGLTFY